MAIAYWPNHRTMAAGGRYTSIAAHDHPMYLIHATLGVYPPPGAAIQTKVGQGFYVAVMPKIGFLCQRFTMIWHRCTPGPLRTSTAALVWLEHKAWRLRSQRQPRFPPYSILVIIFSTSSLSSSLSFALLVSQVSTLASILRSHLRISKGNVVSHLCPQVNLINPSIAFIETFTAKLSSYLATIFLESPLFRSFL
ncbi:hypothetical protein J5N97_010056 [Dioscorea zingiberensis]|uniref:Uncharacterized protein n=1 Tax=Dioscorea zingiberensis TaxID=325984 RepID=A0A9D5CY21_9LILI|nr:hypothetical protein J5N97_010056 [Dioscorea zingiberensis]